MVAALALGACRSSSSPAPPQPPSSGGAAEAELAAFVPADTAAALFFDRALIDHPLVGGDAALAEPRRDLAAAAAGPRTTPAERFWGLIAEELAPLDKDALRRFGWISGKSTVVVYTVGLVPVVRARVDGKTFRAMLDRASAASGLKPTEGNWQGKPYLSFKPGEEEMQILLAISDDQVVMAVASRPERVLGHLTDFAPRPDSLASAWPIADGAGRFSWLEPSRFGALIADPEQLRILIGDDEDTPNATCLGAVGRFIATLPRMTSTTIGDDRRFSMQVVFELSDEVAAMLRGGPVPGWPDDGKRKVPTMRMGMGAAPYPLVVRAIGLAGDVVAAGAACGGEADMPAMAKMVAELAPLQIVQGATWEMAVFDGVEVTMTLALAVRDVPALWTMLATAVPMLGRTVPAIGEVRDVPGPGPIKIGVGRDRMVGSIGAGADRRVRDYLDAAPGPRTPMISRIDLEMMTGFRDGSFRFLGEPMKDDDPDDGTPILGDVILDSRVEGSRLIIDTSVYFVR